MSMKVREDMVNGHAICHGGLIFTLADSTFAFACNSYNHVAVAQGANIEFLAPGKLGDVLTAIGEERHHAGKTGVYDIRVSNQDGRTIALFRGKSFRIGGHLVEPTQEEKA
jgi:acyl-CoA thioesterase